MDKKIPVAELIVSIRDALREGETMDHACICGHSFQKPWALFDILLKALGKEGAWKVIKLAVKMHNAAGGPEAKIDYSFEGEAQLPCIKMRLLLVVISLLHDESFIIE